jgi:uncharacterized protein
VESAIFGLLGNPIDLSLVPEKLVGFVPSVIVLTLVAGLGKEPGWGKSWAGVGSRCPASSPATRLWSLRSCSVLSWALWHLPLVFVELRFSHGFRPFAPLELLALLTLVGIALMAFFYTWVYNATQSVLLCMLLHGSFNTATGLVPAPFEVLQRGVYVTLLVVQDVTLLVAVAVLVVATGGRLAYNASIARAAP